MRLIEILRNWFRKKIALLRAIGPRQRIFLWQSSPRYWSYLSIWRKLHFSITSFVFHLEVGRQSNQETFSTFRTLITLTLSRFFLAFILIFALESLEHFVLSPIFTTILSPIISQLGLKLDATTYTQILLVLAQIAAVFLGLYFTAISVVASTIYARIPGDVRGLFLSERLGNTYSRTVAFLAAVCTLLLVFISFGMQPGVLNFLVVAFLSIVSILSFVDLGLSTFNLFDPTLLTRNVTYQLGRWVRGATAPNFAWQDPSFQLYYQQRAESLLETLRNVIALANEKDYQYLQGAPLNQLLVRLLSLLQFYGESKCHIPSQSNWFKQTYKHPRWFNSSDSQISIALQTGTPLQPEIDHDYFWFENTIEETLVTTIRSSLERNDVESAAEITNGIQHTLATITNHYLVDEALRFFDGLSVLIREYVETAEENSDEERSFSYSLALADVYGMSFISIELGCCERFDSLTVDFIRSILAKIQWNHSETIYLAEIPRSVLFELENIQERACFEKAVEGEILSPQWFFEQLVGAAFARFVSDTSTKIVDVLDHAFTEKIRLLLKGEKYLIAAQLIARGLEACEKANYLLSSAETCEKRLLQLRRTTDFSWTQVEWDALATRIEQTHEHLVIAFGQCAIDLSQTKHTDHMPDYFGHAYSVLADECYQAMATGNETLFRRIFPEYFSAALLAFEKLKSDFADWNEEAKIIISTEPIEDLLQISGYAIVYSELDKKAYWRIVERLWQNYFDSPAKDERIRFVFTIANYRDTLFRITYRSILRTGWKQQLSATFREKNIADDDPGIPFRGRRRSTHPSPLIRVLARSGDMLFDDGSDVFLVAYMSKLPEAAGLNLPRNAQSLKEMLERQQPEKGRLGDEEI